MKRALILLLVAAATVLANVHQPEAQAHRWGFGRYYGGYRGFGYRGFGYRGFGYRGFGYRGFGFRSYGFYRPRISVGFGYGGFGYGYRPYYGGYYGGYYPSYYRAYYPTYGYGYGCASTGPTVINNVVSVPPPVYANSALVYGPDAVKQFMGVDRDFAKGPLAAPPVVVDRGLDDGRRLVSTPAKKDVAKPLVASNAEAKARAERFISFGDGQFGEQKYHSAAQRYREAIESAPDVADAHFRQAFAYIASNRHEHAITALKRGLAIDPLWVNSSFRIDDLYEGNKISKNAHIEALAKAALDDRRNSDHFFLLGVLLHFDGQQDRAVKFFKEAQRFAGADSDHISAFLVPAAPDVDDAV